MSLQNRRGQTLVIAVMLMLVALIMIPLLVLYVQNEAKWSVKQSRANTAYHLAEAGQDRAVWYLAQSTANWSAALAGTALTGYNGDAQYSDVSGGLYDIRITSGPLSSNVTVLSKGRDTSTKETRAIKGVYDAGLLLSGFIATGSIDYKASFIVHWGQVTSFTSITLANSNADYFPLKDSKGAVDPWDTNATPPNADSSKGYTSYDSSLATPPLPDFDYYRAAAKNTRLPNPGSVGGGSDGGQSATYDGSGYFDGTGEVKFKSYNVDCATCVIFLESSDTKLEDSASSRGFMHIGALIVYQGNIHIHANGQNPYTVSVPTDAWKQYTAGTFTAPHSPDSAASDEYPGDGGTHVVKPTYTMPTTTFDGSGNTGVGFHGFLYTYSFNCSGGNNIIVGQLLIGAGGSKINTMDIYYDPDIGSSVHYTKSQVRRISWDELASSWP